MKKIFSVAAALALFCIAASAKSDKALRATNVNAGPWTTNVTETGFNVVWTTPCKCITFVEVAPGDGTAFNSCERPRFYQTKNGRAYAGRFHSVRVYGLEPGKRYRYRMFMQPVTDDSNPYAIDYGPVLRSTDPWWKDFETKTMDSSAKTCRFSMVNDMHDKKAKYKNLVKSLKPSDIDFLLLNGDIVSHSHNIDTVADHTFGPARDLLYCTPVVYARGNHESRGRDFDLVDLLTPTPTGEFYYVFRQGPVGFIVLDASEDKPDSSPEYSGYAHFDAYRAAELEWLKTAVDDPLFKDAPVKIAIMHIPPRTGDSAWYTDRWLVANFVPLLNKAGVDLMLSAHKHRYIWFKEGCCGNEFPILVNSNVDRLDVEADASGIRMHVIDAEGKEIHTHEVGK